MDFFDYRPDFNISDCTQRWPNEEDGDEMRQAYFMSLTVFCYVLPLTIVVGTFHSISCQQQVEQNHKRGLRRDRRTKTSGKAKRKTKLQSKKASYSSRHSFCCHHASLERFSPRCFVLERNCPTKISLVYFNICVFSVIINSSINFFICSLASDEFRQGFKRFFSWTTGEISNPQSVTEPRVPRSSLSPLSPVDLGNINQSSLNERDE